MFSCREKQSVEPDSDLGIAQVQQWYENRHSSIRNGSLLDTRQSASGRTRKVINPDWRYAEHKTDGKGQSFWLIPINSAAEYNLGGIGFRNLLIRKGDDGRAEAFVAEMIGEGEYLKRKNNKIDPKDFTGQVTLYYTEKEGIYAAGRFENGKNLYFGFTDSTASKEAANSKGGRVSGNVIKSCETRTYCDPTAYTPAQNSCNCNAAQTSYVGSTIQETNNAIPFSLNNCRTYERCDYYYYRTSYQNSGDYYNNPYGGGGSGGSSGGGTQDPVPQWLIDYIKWQQEELDRRRIVDAERERLREEEAQKKFMESLGSAAETQYYIMHPQYLPGAWRNRSAAEDKTKEYYGNFLDDQINQNAFKHMYWSGLNAIRWGSDVARTMGQVHEPRLGDVAYDPIRNPIDSEMDLWNNELGIGFVERTKNSGVADVEILRANLEVMVLQYVNNGWARRILNGQIIPTDNTGKIK